VGKQFEQIIMKKHILIIIISLFTIYCYSQSKNFEYGIKGGLSLSSYIANNDEVFPTDFENKAGFFIGIFTKYKFNDKIYIKPELIYIEQGSEFTIPRSSLNSNIFQTSLSGTINESLLLLPIMLEYSLSKKVNFEIGPQIGYSLNREIEYQEDNLGFELLNNENSEKFEFGLGIGLEYCFLDNLSIALRYNYGIVERQDLNTSVIQLGLNYK
jgi:opacity protein-like surface antigen